MKYVFINSNVYFFMQVTENLLQRFFDQQCSAEEADTVVSYLYAHPEEVERWLGPDWQQAGKEIPVPASYRKEIWKRVSEEISFTAPRRTVNRKTYLSAAAAILLLLCGWWFFKQDAPIAAEQPQLVFQQRDTATELRINTTAHPVSIQLPDRSVVILEPGAVIKYAKGFGGRERKIQLTGNGFFEVQKDASRPFTVLAGEITTTALGTSFRVAENKEGVTVKLYTGKVVVNKLGSTTHWSGPVYLLPGTAMTYSVKETRTTIAGFVPEKRKNTTIAQKPVITKKIQISAAELSFDNTSLQEVLEQMEAHFGIEIQYEQSDIDDHYFTGKVLPTDSAELLLNVIGNINGLTIKKEGKNRFLLLKNQ